MLLPRASPFGEGMPGETPPPRRGRSRPTELKRREGIFANDATDANEREEPVQVVRSNDSFVRTNQFATEPPLSSSGTVKSSPHSAMAAAVSAMRCLSSDSSAAQCRHYRQSGENAKTACSCPRQPSHTSWPPNGKM